MVGRIHGYCLQDVLDVIQRKSATPGIHRWRLCHSHMQISLLVLIALMPAAILWLGWWIARRKPRVEGFVLDVH